MSPDQINGSIEFIGALFTLLNVRQLWFSKHIMGVSWWPTLFFFGWGVWNLFYYPSLHQPFSFMGGCALVTVNCVWLVLLGLFSL